MKKIIVFIPVFVLFVILMFIIVKKDDIKNSEFYDKVYTDTSHENSNVKIKYPQFNDNIHENINELISDFAENIAPEAYGEDYINLNLEISDYDVTYYNNNLLSIVFEANGYVSTAASPNNFVRAINIDVENASIISLSDIYSIDDDFAEVVDSNFHEQFLPKKLKEWGINKDHELYEKYKNDLAHSGPCNLQGTLENKKRFYFSENAVIICAGVEHAIGDHFEIEVDYSELKKFLKTDIEPFAKKSEWESNISMLINNNVESVRLTTYTPDGTFEKQIDSDYNRYVEFLMSVKTIPVDPILLNGIATAFMIGLDNRSELRVTLMANYAMIDNEYYFKIINYDEISENYHELFDM